MVIPVMYTCMTLKFFLDNLWFYNLIGSLSTNCKNGNIFRMMSLIDTYNDCRHYVSFSCIDSWYISDTLSHISMSDVLITYL